MPTGIIGALERMRRGFQDGGFTGGQLATVPTNSVQINQQNTIREGVDWDVANERLLFELNRF